MGIAELRKRLGLSQEELCRRLGISRPALSAIERGKEQPRVGLAIRLAGELGVGVEELFGAGALSEALGESTLGVYGEVGNQLILRELPNGYLGGSWLPPNASVGPRGSVERMGEPAVLVDGCDPILGFLSAHLGSRLGRSFYWWSMPNSASLDNLAAGRTHLALVHLPEGEVPQLPEGWPAAVPLAAWELCIAAKPGNPAGVHTVADLFSPAVRFAARVEGSGVRRLSDDWAAEHGARLDPGGFASHLEAASAVRFGEFDATLTMRGTAAALDLECTPVGVQRSWLAYTKASESDSRVADALDEIESRRMSRLLGVMPNYLGVA
ncbi:MAG: helix-turn-helix domain-containing protein [Actinomycetota bacterium]|nr:helix-turn-helix domain-containing protein [Actinomycetota bacterium]MDA8208540.1 helix-turn-helix domain-containing protein [Actinomycetota bacterium]